MFNKIIKLFDSSPDDYLTERIEKEPIVSKYWFNLGGTILFLILSIFISTVVLIQRKKHTPPLTSGVNIAKNTIENIQTLPFPHQSLKNIDGWLNEAITNSYAFDFNHIDEQIKQAEYYFTPTGYAMYLKALESNHIRNDVLLKKVDIGIVPLQNAVVINEGTSGDTEFWRFRQPVLISYYAGKEPITLKVLIEVLIIRVPAYQNPKGLAITEFNMN